MKRTKIAIVCQNDTLWSLYAWNKTFPLLKANPDYEIAGFWVCDEKFMNVPKDKVLNWYFNVFGALNFVLMAMFKLTFDFVTTIKSITSGYNKSFKSLCEQHSIPYHSVLSPNNKELTEWVKSNQIDIMIVMVGHILKGEILNAPANCIINKHAALLPANKGVFPYFWARLKDEPQGISFHKVIGEIDGGEILYQEKVKERKWLSSMISFYFYTYKNYGRMLMVAIKNAINSYSVTPDASVKSSYFSGPKPEDFKKFKKAGGKIITVIDLFLPFNL